MMLFGDTDDCVWPVLSMSEAPHHPHNQTRNSFIEVAGVMQPAPTPKLSRTPAQILQSPPLLGEHTRQQLLTLGLSGEEVDRLIALGAVKEATLL